MSVSETGYQDQAARPEPAHVFERAGDHVHLGLFVQLSVFAVVGTLLMLLAPEAPWSVKLLLIALVFLTLKRWGGVLVLMLVQTDLFLREGREFPILRGSDGVIFVFVVVAVLMFVARQRLLLQQIARDTLSSLAKSLFTPDTTASPREERDDVGKVVRRTFGAAFRGANLLFCCVAGARILIGILPTNRELTGNLRELAGMDPQMSTAVILGVSLVAAWTVLSEISWRQMTVAQSRMYLRSTFVKDHYRDLRLIVMRRLKIRRQRLAAMSSKKPAGKK